MMSIIDNESSINKLQNILVSIIIPVYNAEKTLHKCLKSVVQQTHREIQIILVNDGSTDLSEMICQEYSNEDPRVEYYHKGNGGASSARNLGISKVKGKYLQFVDADDFIDHDLIASLLQSITETDSDVSVFGLIYEYEKYQRYTHFDSATINRLRKGGLQENVIYLQDEGLLGYACNKLYKTAYINDHLIRFNEEIPLYEDLLFNCEFLKRTRSIVVAPFCKYHYVQSSYSASVKHDSKHFTYAEQAINKIKDLLLHYKVDRSVMKRLLFQFAYHSIKAYLLRLGQYSFRDFEQKLQVIFDCSMLPNCLLEAPEYIPTLKKNDRIIYGWIVKRRATLLYCTVVMRDTVKKILLGGNRT